MIDLSVYANYNTIEFISFLFEFTRKSLNYNIFNIKLYFLVNLELFIFIITIIVIRLIFLYLFENFTNFLANFRFFYNRIFNSSVSAEFFILTK